MSLQVVSEFKACWHTFWATSYSFDLGFIDEFLFRRLGNPPLNATVLVDFDQFSSAWEDFLPGEEILLRRVNRDYLLRGVPRTGGAFHPKTIFLGDDKEQVLLVGSGNLTLDGLDQGYEVFCRFSSTSEHGSATIRDWRSWMDWIVTDLDDREVSYRWHELLRSSRWSREPSVPSPFAVNWTTSLVDQFGRVLERPVDELHVLAPFFDDDGDAFRELIRVTRPREVHLYLPHGISADGRKLRAILAAAGADIHLIGFDRHDFVHAKLFGVTCGERGWLLSGSANASRRALLAACEQSPFSNVEAGILAELDAVTIRQAFCPPRWKLRHLDDAVLEEIHLRREPSSSPRPPIALTSAAAQPDGIIVLSFSPSWPDDLHLTDGISYVHVTNWRTTDALSIPATGAVVWLVDTDGSPLSNRVPVDDPVALRGWLQERAGPGDRPRELQPEDFATPIGRMLERLNQEFIFDIDDTPAAAAASRRTGSEDEADGDDGFWERFAADEIRLDPRAARYDLTNLQHGIAGVIEDDEVLALLREMLDRIRGEERAVMSAVSTQESASASGPAWTAQRKLQTRLANVLGRWSRSLADPRLLWLGPQAPLCNYRALSLALCECWLEGFLRIEQVVRTSYDLLASFVQGENAPGYLVRVPENERATIAGNLGATSSIAAALAYVALRPQTGWRETVFRWQSFLGPAMQLGVMKADENAAALVRLATREDVTPARIDQVLRRAQTYTTDERWESRLEAELGLERIEIVVDHAAHGRFPLHLEVWGIADPLDAPALVSLVRRAFSYRNVPGVRLTFPDRSTGDRMAFAANGPAFAVVDNVDFECDDCVSDQVMELLESERAGWREFMRVSTP